MFDGEKATGGIQTAAEHSGLTRGMGQPGTCQGRLLVIDDQFARRRAMHTTLFSMGFEIAEASSSAEALALCRIIRCDAVLLAINGHGTAGIDMCAELRRLLPRTAILAMSANEDEERKVDVPDAGADDYVTPSHMRELTARVRAALRRSKAVEERESEHIVVGNIEIFPPQRLVLRAGNPVHLTRREFDLLHLLMANAGLPVTHERLLRAVWGDDSANQVEYLRTYMRQLRRKLEDDPANPRYLLTDSHIGYRFTNPAARFPQHQPRSFS